MSKFKKSKYPSYGAYSRPRIKPSYTWLLYVFVAVILIFTGKNLVQLIERIFGNDKDGREKDGTGSKPGKDVGLVGDATDLLLGKPDVEEPSLFVDIDQIDSMKKQRLISLAELAYHAMYGVPYNWGDMTEAIPNDLSANDIAYMVNYFGIRRMPLYDTWVSAQFGDDLDLIGWYKRADSWLWRNFYDGDRVIKKFQDVGLW